MKRKTDFSPFAIGTIFNPLPKPIRHVSPKFSFVSIRYPSRLNAMALDPSKITSNDNLKYTPGEIIFKVKIYKTVNISIFPLHGEIEISDRTQRQTLVKHAALILKKAIGFTNKIYIDVDNRSEIKHAGLGSSSSLIAAVACAINEIFNNPFSQQEMLRYLAQNHGEEIDGDHNKLYPVQCIGGSAAGGLFEGGMLVLGGENTVIANMLIPSKFKATIGIPKDFKSQDSQTLMQEEIKAFPKFLASGKKHGKDIAYRMLHEVLPAMQNQDIKTIGDLIFDYRYHMGSINNCSYCYPKIVSLAKKLSYIKNQGIAEILSISSVGPAFFAISKNHRIVESIFKKHDLITVTTEIENNPYTIISKKVYRHG